ncbi:hypothetical protein TYRP_013057 [Tyrophagus putrescentiae]|nr:hypothetical protein TYRP_013057 [Tyrophagus putrescentiae]
MQKEVVLLVLAGQVEDLLLLWFHAADVLLQRHLLSLARRVAQQIGQQRTVERVLVDAQLQVLAVLLVEEAVHLRLLVGNLPKQLQTLLHQVFANDFEEVALLQRLAADVQRQVIAVDDAFQEVQDNVPKSLLFQKMTLVIFELEDHLGATSQLVFATVVRCDGEGAVGSGLPDVLSVVVVVLRHHCHLLGDQVGRVEADAKLANGADVCASFQRLEEGARSGAGDRAQAVDQIGLGHADARVEDGEGARLAVGGDANEELGDGGQDRGVSQRLVANLVEGVAGVADQLAQKDLLVRVEGVDDQTHQLGDLRLKGEGLRRSRGQR